MSASSSSSLRPTVYSLIFPVRREQRVTSYELGKPRGIDHKGTKGTKGELGGRRIF
jgi:hypothetical protein